MSDVRNVEDMVVDQLEHRNHARMAVTIIVILLHGAFALLAHFGRLAYSVGPDPDSNLDVFLQVAAWNPFWILAHGAVFLVGAGALLWRRNWLDEVLYAGFGFMGAWGIINLMWGLETTEPISLAGPTLAIAVALITRYLSRSWSRGVGHGKG